jgi:hypothetical protein
VTTRALLQQLERLPDEALLPIGWLRSQLDTDLVPDIVARSESAAPTWQERFWTVPPDTRIGVSDLSEALDRPVSWVYRRTSSVTSRARERAEKRRTRIPERIPHRKLDGALTFVVGEIRAWIADREEIIIAAPQRAVRALR